MPRAIGWASALLSSRGGVNEYPVPTDALCWFELLIIRDTHDKSAAFEARTFVMSLSLRGVHVVIEAPTPVFKSPPFRCSDWFNRTNPVCDAGFSVSRKEIERRRSEVVEIAIAMTVAIPSVVLWDPLPILCSQQRCSAFGQSGPLFFRRRSSERIRK